MLDRSIEQSVQARSAERVRVECNDRFMNGRRWRASFEDGLQQLDRLIGRFEEFSQLGVHYPQTFIGEQRRLGRPSRAAVMHPLRRMKRDGSRLG